MKKKKIPIKLRKQIVKQLKEAGLISSLQYYQILYPEFENHPYFNQIVKEYEDSDL